MKPTDISVRTTSRWWSQWACPAHTPVPEYIRLIAAGRYSDAYMINWEFNVFPGILGELRPPLRTGLPPCPGGERAGGDLPIEARRRRFQGRYPRPAAQASGAEKRQAHRAHRRRTGLTDGGARPRTDGLHLCHIRSGSAVRRHDATRSRNSACRKPYSTRNANTSSTSVSISSAASASTASRRCWPRTMTRSLSAAARRAAAISTFPAARKPSRTSISASIGSPASRSAISTGLANA